MIIASVTKSNALDRLDQIINPFQDTVVIIMFKRIFYVTYVFLDCLDGGFHIPGYRMMFTEYLLL